MMPKLFKFLLIIIASLGSLLSYSASDPDWFVNISTTTATESIEGVGYIVQVGDNFYIRTASHVTLGTDYGDFISGTGEALKVIKGKSLIDNEHDDQLIPISKPSKSKSIAFYSPSLKKFVVWPKRSNEVKSLKGKKEVEQGYGAAFYITPKVMNKRKKNKKFKPLKESIFTTFTPSTDFSNKLRTVKGESTLTADMKVLPGESGSPVFKDIIVGYDIQDMNGKYYKYPLPNMSGGATILFGHAQTYQRFVERSNFSSSTQSERIVEAIKKPEILNSNVKWDRYQGIFYRYIKTDKGLIQELNNLKIQSGNGTGGSGGIEFENRKLDLSGTAKMGMIYQDKAIAAFKVVIKKNGKKLKEYTLYADWENYQYIEDLKRNPAYTVEVEAVELNGEGLSSLISDKVRSNLGTHQTLGRTSRCVIDGEALSYNFLNLNIQPFEVVSIPLDEAFFPIVDVKSKDDGEIYKLDLRGLFSVDIMEFTDERWNSELNFYDENSYVMLKADGYKYSRAKCKVHYGGMGSTRSRLFEGGKLIDPSFEIRPNQEFKKNRSTNTRKD